MEFTNHMKIVIDIYLGRIKFLWIKKLYLWFFVLHLSKLLMYEQYYDKLQSYLGQENYNYIIRIVIVLYWVLEHKLLILI